MSAIEEAIGGIQSSRDSCDDAWNSAAEAKEFAGEAIDKLTAVTGPDVPDLASIPLNMLIEAQNQIEQGQALLSQAQDALEEYSTSLG